MFLLLLFKFQFLIKHKQFFFPKGSKICSVEWRCFFLLNLSKKFQWMTKKHCAIIYLKENLIKFFSILHESKKFFKTFLNFFYQLVPIIKDLRDLCDELDDVPNVLKAKRSIFAFANYVEVVMLNRFDIALKQQDLAKMAVCYLIILLFYYNHF